MGNREWHSFRTVRYHRHSEFLTIDTVRKARTIKLIQRLAEWILGQSKTSESLKYVHRYINQNEKFLFDDYRQTINLKRVFLLFSFSSPLIEIAEPKDRFSTLSELFGRFKSSLFINLTPRSYTHGHICGQINRCLLTDVAARRRAWCRLRGINSENHTGCYHPDVITSR